MNRNRGNLVALGAVTEPGWVVHHYFWHSPSIKGQCITTFDINLFIEPRWCISDWTWAVHHYFWHKPFYWSRVHQIPLLLNQGTCINPCTPPFHRTSVSGPAWSTISVEHKLLLSILLNHSSASVHFLWHPSLVSQCITTLLSFPFYLTRVYEFMSLFQR